VVEDAVLLEEPHPALESRFTEAAAEERLAALERAGHKCGLCSSTTKITDTIQPSRSP
jgi:hypothetical protein